PHRIEPEQRMENVRERRMLTRIELDGGVRRDRLEPRALIEKPALDPRDDALAFPFPSVDCEPPRAFGDPHPPEEDDHAERRAGQEGEAPSELGIEERRIEERHRDQGAERRADPETAVDRQIEVSAVASGNQLLNGRIDGGIFSADAAAGEEPE